MKKIFLTILLCFFVVMGGADIAKAVEGDADPAGSGETVSESGSSEEPKWPEEDVKSYLNRIEAANINQFIGKVISTGVGLIGSVALAMFAYAGITWMVSMDGDKKAKASKTLMWSSLGLIVIMASYAIVTFVFNMIK